MLEEGARKMSIKIGDAEYDAVEFRPRGGRNAYGETRYCIVDASTGEIVDDAQGYGYKTVRKAYAGFGFRTKAKASAGSVKAYAKNVKARRREILDWIHHHRDLEDELEDEAMERARNGEPELHPSDVEAILARLGLECPYPVSELLAAW